MFPTPTPTPFPHLVAHNAAEADMFHMLSQIQGHTFSNNQAFFGSMTLTLPLPIAWRLALYHFLTALPIPPIPTWLIALLFILSPLIFLALVFLAYKFIPRIIETFLPFIASRFSKASEEKTFLELTFPHDTSKSSYATEQLYKTIHILSSMQGGFFKSKKTYSLEVVSTLDRGIRYIIGIPPADIDVIKRSLLAYLPGLAIKEIPDYLSNAYLFKESLTSAEIEEKIRLSRSLGVLEFTLSRDFTLPLRDQKKLGVHDSIAFLTGNMTKPKAGELLAFQIVISPTLNSKIKRRMQEVKNTIYQGKQLSPVVNKKGFLSGTIPSPLFFILSPILWVVVFAGRLIIKVPYLILDPNGSQSKDFFNSTPKVPLQFLLNPYEQELTDVVKGKLSEHLFETSIRFFIATNEAEEFYARQTGLVASFGQFSSEYQSLTIKGITSIPFLSKKAFRKRIADFSRRILSANPTILSSSELSDLYHFPNMDITKIEGLAKSKSHELPAPTSMKRDYNDMDILVGKNTYGGEDTGVGLRGKDRGQHTYIIGKTGMGKSTIIEAMAFQDIQNRKGVCVIDPHGDMVKHLLSIIPKSRQKDVVYLDPFDKENPVGLNILNPHARFSDIEEEHRRIAMTVMSIFMKITPEKHWGQRMEHILRNAILTVLQIPTGMPETPYVCLYTIQKLLTDSTYRKSVTGQVQDPILKQFWEKEYSLFTKNKQGDMIAPLTNKIGEFITDPLSRYILLQKESTINISEIMDQGKILLVNLSKGNIGEERSAFFGTIITSLIQLATYARAQIPEKDRRDFFVYIDEFQNFATPHFTDLFSESRKYHVFFTPSHQNIAQIDDPKVSKIIKGNSGTYIVLRSSPEDEKLLLPIFSPEVEEGQIVNLPPHHFFMKVTNEESEDAFTGETVRIEQQGDETVKNTIIEYSQRHFAIPREEAKKQLEMLLKPSPASRKKRKPKKDEKGKETKPNGIKHDAQQTKRQMA